MNKNPRCLVAAPRIAQLPMALALALAVASFQGVGPCEESMSPAVVRGGGPTGQCRTKPGTGSFLAPGPLARPMALCVPPGRGGVLAGGPLAEGRGSPGGALSSPASLSNSPRPPGMSRVQDHVQTDRRRQQPLPVCLHSPPPPPPDCSGRDARLDKCEHHDQKVLSSRSALPLAALLCSLLTRSLRNSWASCVLADLV